MRIKLQSRPTPTGKPVVIYDSLLRSDYVEPLSVTENDNLSISVSTDDSATVDLVGVRAYVGDVLVASTEEVDRPDFFFEPADDDSDVIRFVTKVPRHETLLQHWIGLSEINVYTRGTTESWQLQVSIAVAVSAAKISSDEFGTICDRLSDVSSALLLDVYGKTFVGIHRDEKPGSSAPVVMVDRLQALCRSLLPELKSVLKNPSFRLGAVYTRQPAHAGMSVLPEQLEAACLDPSMLRRNRPRPVFVETVSEQTQVKFSLPENKVIGEFLKLCLFQGMELRRRITAEIVVRTDRQRFRNQRKEGEKKSWWETEDLPRIEQLENLLPALDHTIGSFNGMLATWLVPVDAPLRSMPTSTPLFRTSPHYGRVFRLMKEHYQSSRVIIDSDAMLKQIKSIPVLFEWWCVLEVVSYLNRSLEMISTGDSNETPFKRLVSAGTDRFVISLESQQFLEFVDPNGMLVRLRYEPRYQKFRKNSNSDFGLLSEDGSLRTPDIAIEVYEKSRGSVVPSLIIILDAKYTRSSHETKLQDLKGKYCDIGIFKTGTRLSRQIWALTPVESGHAHEPGLRGFCSADNPAFWNTDFDFTQKVAGAVEMRPASAETDAPLEQLLSLVLRRAGVQLRQQLV